MTICGFRLARQIRGTMTENVLNELAQRRKLTDMIAGTLDPKDTGNVVYHPKGAASLVVIALEQAGYQVILKNSSQDQTVNVLRPFHTTDHYGNVYQVVHGNVAIDGPTDVTLVPDSSHTHEKCPNYGDHCKLNHEWCEQCEDFVHSSSNEGEGNAADAD